jgi:hypothetical protein
MYRHMPTCSQGFVPHNRLHGLFDAPAKADEIRRDLVARVRREIAEGVYETPEKWEIALDRMAQGLE